MKTLTAAYDARRMRLVQLPAYLVRFYHVDRAGVGAESVFSRDFVTHDPPGLARPYLRCAKRPTGNTQTVVPESGQSSIGVFTLPLVDLDGEIMRYLANPKRPLRTSLSAAGGEVFVEAAGDISGYPSMGTLSLLRSNGTKERVRYLRRDDALSRFHEITRAVDNTSLLAHTVGDTIIENGEQICAAQRVQCWAGYQDEDVADWMPVTKMEVLKTGMQGPSTFAVTIADILRSTTRTIFTAATQEAPLQFAGNLMECFLMWLMSSGTAVVSTGTVQITGPKTVTGTGTLFTNMLSNGDVVVLGLGDLIQQRWVTVESVVDDLRFTTVETMTTSPAGLSYRKAGTRGKYDVLAGGNGLGIPQLYADVKGLETLRDTDFAGTKYTYRINQPEDAKRFFEQELQAANSYPFVTQDGKWSIRRYRPVTPATTPVARITADEIVSFGWDGGDEKIINVVEIQYDWNVASQVDDFAIRQRYRFLKSIEDHDERPPLRLRSMGLRTTDGAQAIAEDRAFSVGKRWANPIPKLNLVVFYRHHPLDIGDIVSVSHPRIPNRSTGHRGLTDELFEVTDLQLFATGGVVLGLLHVGATTIPPAPVSGGAENNLQTLIVNRAEFFNAASVAVSGTEIETASVTVTLTRDTDSIVVSARQYLDVSGANGSVTSRIRIATLAGLQIDGISLPQLLEGAGSKTATWRGAGITPHDVLYVRGTKGPLTVKMSAISPGGATGIARDRSLIVTVRGR